MCVTVDEDAHNGMKKEIDWVKIKNAQNLKVEQCLIKDNSEM